MYQLILLNEETGVVVYYETSTDYDALKVKFDALAKAGKPVSIVDMSLRAVVNIANERNNQ